MLLVSLGVTLFAGALLLERYFGMDKSTAILATSPGTMTNALAIALEGCRRRGIQWSGGGVQLRVLVSPLGGPRGAVGLSRDGWKFAVETRLAHVVFGSVWWD